jgi:hypothetical protein
MLKRIMVHNERIEIEILRSALRQTVLGVSDDSELPIKANDWLKVLFGDSLR